MELLKTTPLHAAHVALGAKMVPFAGFDMPVQYSGIIDEHMSVRNAAGLFDVSHMGEVMVRGSEAFDFVQRLVTNDAAKLSNGKAMYTVMCREHGGAVDDLLVYRLSEDEYMLVINASNIEKDLDHIREQHEASGFDCSITDISDSTALLAIQGPKAFDIVADVADLSVHEIPFYSFIQPDSGEFLGCERAILSHTGYTGEKGLEIYCEPEKAVEVWNALLAAGEKHGLKPAGLGARDTLRLEAGYCLYGHELTEEVNPLEAGLGWVTKPDAAEFVGAGTVRKMKSDGIPRKLIGFVVEERGIARQGSQIINSEGVKIGEVTSGTQSPVLAKGIGLGFVVNKPEFTTPGAKIFLNVRNRTLEATVTKPP
ncbi:MAG: glycine cleavage system aminomethyltransferase GcvT, partial [Rubricoccaceae bacterium]|nr:glycine cleavage system aminomethyltransferase GcvT [Rubricoccaceae bacterium]